VVEHPAAAAAAAAVAAAADDNIDEVTEQAAARAAALQAVCGIGMKGWPRAAAPLFLPLPMAVPGCWCLWVQTWKEQQHTQQHCCVHTLELYGLRSPVRVW
jgi:hypothetical protein